MSEGVAICSVGELFGGVERHILGLLQGLASQGVPATLVLFTDAELAAQARGQGFDVVVLPGRNAEMIATARRLAALLAERGIGLVHAHGYKAMVYCAIARMFRPFGIVKTEHGLAEPMAGLAAIRERMYRWADRVATRRTGACVCYVTADLARQHAAGDSAPIVIPNGVPPMEPADWPVPPEYDGVPFKAADVGRLDTVKGHHVAIAALTAGAPADAHLFFLGTGPREAMLRELAERSGVAERVHFLGFRRDVLGYIGHADALLMPSLHEGLPYTLLEAMALGTPIVASRVGGLAEVLRDGETGLLVPVGDADALGLALSNLAGNVSLRRSLAVHARREQREHFTLEAMTCRYLEIYRQRQRSFRARMP
jgi:glycosyltransferase involved in cell wall biosynthesis